MELLHGYRYLLDTTVFIDFDRQLPAVLEIIQQARHPDINVQYSFVTYWELRLGISTDIAWNEEDRYEILQPYPMIGLHPDIGELAERMQHQLQEKNARRKDKLSLPEFNDCYIAASARIHDLRVVTRNHRHFPQFRDLGELSITVDLYEAT